MDQPQLGRFGDRRLAATGDVLLAAMQKQRTMCLHALAGDRSESAPVQRLPRQRGGQPARNAGRMPAADRRARGRVGTCWRIADTSELNYATHSGRKRGFGTVGNGQDIGVLVHPIIAVDAEQGGIIGLVGAEVINRSQGPLKTTRGARRREGVPSMAGRGGDRGSVLAEAAMITWWRTAKATYTTSSPAGRNVHLLVRAAQIAR